MRLFERNIFVIETFALSPSFLSCIDSREKAFGVFLIMIHGPSSLFVWRLVDVSWFSSLFKRCVFSRGTFLWLKLSLYLISFLSCIDSREKSFGLFLIMIHGPSSLFIWRLVETNKLEGPWIIIKNTPKAFSRESIQLRNEGDRAKVSMTKMFLSKRRIFYINLKISPHQRVVR